MTRRKRLFLHPSLPALAFLAAAIVVPLYAYKVFLKTDYTDFSVYYRAAVRFAHGQWSEVYTLADGASPFRYAPILLPFFLPFAALPLIPAQLVWYFLQVSCFALGFWLLGRSLRLLTPRSGAERSGRARIATSLAFLFILRFCLDTFTIGQVSSVMFLGYALAFYGWLYRRFPFFGAGLFIPSVLKIGPAFLFGLPLLSRRRCRVLSLKGAFFSLLLLNALTWVLVRLLGGTTSIFNFLWKQWARIVAGDSSYYDASHYGSQSLKSFLLRLAHAGHLGAGSVDWIWFLSAGAVCTGVLSFWFLRRPKGPVGRALFFCLGIFPYLWFMPETFKYALTLLAFPVAVLILVPGLQTLDQAVLALGGLTLSLAGKDVIGGTLFFGLQRASIPLLAYSLIGLAVFRQAWRFSIPQFRLHSLGPWKQLPGSKPELARSILVPIRLDAAQITVNPAERAAALTQDLLRFAGPRGDTEVLFIPYGNRVSGGHPVLKAVTETIPKAVTDGTTTARILIPDSAQGRANALRHGFLNSRGRMLLAFNFEQPCELEFFERAQALGRPLVRANRRDSQTRFIIPVRLLPLVHRRHRLGLLFNRLVRLVLPIGITDTHSGTFVMTRELAEKVFAFQTSPDFLFDLELSLIARAHGFPETDLPVTLYLAQEKTVSRMTQETFTILLGLPRLALRYRRNQYAAPALAWERLKLSADDWGISPAVNDGILQLVRRGVVSRVSLMADARYLGTGLPELLEFQKAGRVSLGFHFNLTYGKPFASPGEFLLKWLFRSRELTAPVTKEWETQLEKLTRAGVRVQYMDGHHHIHIVPGLMRVLAPLLGRAGIRETRLPYDPALWLSSKAPLNLMSLLAKKEMDRAGLAYRSFRYPGLHQFENFGELSAELNVSNETEVMVHPASKADPERWDFPDPYITPRVTEFLSLQMLAHVFCCAPIPGKGEEGGGK